VVLLSCLCFVWSKLPLNRQIQILGVRSSPFHHSAAPNRSNVDLKASRLDHGGLSGLRALGYYFRELQDKTWIIKTKFFSLVDKCPLVFEFSIRKITGEQVLRGMVDYGLTKQELLELASDHLTRKPAQLNVLKARFLSNLDRRYGADTDRTHRLTMPEIKQRLFSAGYSRDNIILLL
jgi:hypothetical protein